MIPKYLTIQGFRSFAKKQTIDFESVPEGLTLVTGVNRFEPNLEGNGAGKSTIFEALTWCLFGKTSTNLKAGDIVNWKGEEKCIVEFCYLDNGIENLIVRTQSPNLLTLNGEVKTQEELEQVINFNLKSFIYSIFISQFGDKFVDLLPSDKMSVFTDIMGEVLNKWTFYSDKAKVRRDKTSEEIASLEKDKSNLEGKIQGIDVEDLSLKFKEWEEENLTSIKELEKRLSEVPVVESLDDSKIKELRKEIEELERKKKEYNDLIDELIKNKYKIEGVASVKEKNKGNLRSLGAKCPICKQTIDKEHIQFELNLLDSELEECTIRKEEISNKISKNEKRFIRTKAEIEELSSEIKQVEKEEEMKAIYIEKSVILKNDIFILKSKENPYESILKKNLKILEESKKQLNIILKSIEEKKKRFEAFKYLTKAFKDIRLMLTAEALTEFEVNVNNNIQKLGLSEEWRVRLNIMEETKSGTIKKGFTILVESPSNKSSVPFECWSGGEGQRLRLAVSLGLSDFIKDRRGINWNWIILDEPSQFLSETGIIQMIDSLKEKSVKDSMKIFLIDHRKLPSFGEFDSFIEVVKTREGSEIYTHS